MHKWSQYILGAVVEIHCSFSLFVKFKLIFLLLVNSWNWEIPLWAC